MMNDGQNSFYVYAPAGDAVEIGDLVEVTCVPTYYYNIIENKSGTATVKVLLSGQEVPEAAGPMTVDELYAAHDVANDHTVAGLRIKLVGMLVKEGQDFKVRSQESNLQATVYYKSYTEFEQQILSEHVGKLVQIETAIYDAHSTGYFRLLPNVYDYPIVDLEMSDEQKVAAVVTQLEGYQFSKVYYAGDVIELPKSSDADVTITWELPEGVQEDVALALEENQTIVVKAVVSCGEASTEWTKELTYKVSSFEFKHTGLSVDDAFTVEEVLAFMANYTDGDTSDTEYYVRGVVTSNTAVSKYGSYTIWLENGDVAEAFQLYSVGIASTVEGDFTAADSMKGLEVVCFGYLKLYGTIYEMPYLGASSSPTGAAYTPSIVSISGTDQDPTDPTDPTDPDEPAEQDSVIVTVVMSEQGWSNAQEVLSISFDDIVVATLDKKSNTNTPKYYDTGASVRLYGGSAISFAAVDGYKIVSVTITFTDNKTSFASITSGTEISVNAQTSSEFVVSGTSGHVRISQITVVYAAE